MILEPNGSGGSRVQVTYELTALSPKGNEDLKNHFSQTKYAAMMEDWQRMIHKNRKKIHAHPAPK